jgi:energy-coupling factor transporter transmembrane protein EcfT
MVLNSSGQMELVLKIIWVVLYSFLSLLAIGIIVFMIITSAENVMKYKKEWNKIGSLFIKGGAILGGIWVIFSVCLLIIALLKAYIFK